MPVDVLILLVNDATCGKPRSVNFNAEKLLRCPNGQDWFSGKGSLELVKCLLLEGTFKQIEYLF
jgi:hypothetical protein